MMAQLFSIFAATAAEDLTAGHLTAETLSVGVSTTVIGMFVVFLVLIILYISIKILSLVVEAVEKRRNPKKGAKVEAAAPASAPAPAVPEGLSAKTVAAIMAAVAAVSGRPVAQLRYTAIRRTPGASNSWAASGTSEIINTRQDYL